MEYPIKDMTIVQPLDASREQVFEAWTDATLLARWWGPQGFTNPVCEIDARKGGLINIQMQAPDGTRYPMTGTIEEIQSPEKLVFTSAALTPEGKKVFDVETIVHFERDGEHTTLTLHASVHNDLPEAVPYLEGMPEGWKQSLERLQALLRK